MRSSMRVHWENTITFAGMPSSSSGIPLQMSAMIGLMTAAEQLTQEQGRATTKEGRCSWYEESCKMGSCVGKNFFFSKQSFTK